MFCFLKIYLCQEARLLKIHLSCVPGSETPGLVTVQLETNDGRVLGSTQFTYKEEICSGFQKILCSANYRGKFMKAFSSNEPSKDSATTDRNETETGKIIIVNTSLFTFYCFSCKPRVSVTFNFGFPVVSSACQCYKGVTIWVFVSQWFLAEMDSGN